MDAWRRIEEQASGTRQEKRLEKDIENTSVTPKVACWINWLGPSVVLVAFGSLTLGRMA